MWPSTFAGRQACRSMGGRGVATRCTARKKVTLQTIRRLYDKQTPITMLTAYDYPTGLLVDRAGVDLCLVGDSLGMVALGYDSTVAVTMQEMLHHCRATRRGCRQAMLVGDMPFGSFQASAEQAIRNGFRMMQEGHVESVKLEAGEEMAEHVRRMVQAGIPVLGHVGLRPQHLNTYGGFRVQGKKAEQAIGIIKDALALQEAGCWGVIIECVPDEVAAAVTQRLQIPTIGIGAGRECSGQVLVYSDVLGLFDKFSPRFCKQYGQLAGPITEALAQYCDETRERRFPAPEHSLPMNEVERERLDEALRVFDAQRGMAHPAPLTASPVKKSLQAHS
ncbi:3-methyl-2-oxobutanoate hydroxymethyltransferase [Syncephalis pseudoplumigaleata]|uniref:3-methyl-2-oxobutanoate hydroxymethyltransferase n=1 Tax=Syncephalis pseudoplumigaleata TaxID=1712513 RepID=A0A4P9YXJ0_9FUNG|nr:3-methyl-2-oxobutanoate hydroxymethyltransferase [Syncephalis pseudoplumigaleata]|eukprot:RKP24595.1 3-methyl-2-oxobutanoate hydroxymethyltransferase [Syncephalis pseudoplumigaleata]